MKLFARPQMYKLPRLWFTLFAAALPATLALGQTVPKYRIDPDQAYGGMVSEYFSEVEYIPLETTKESIFGDVHQLLPTDSGFVIGDRDTRSILVFSTKGKFIRKLNEYGNLHHDKVNNLVIVMKFASNMRSVIFMYYTLSGVPLPERKQEFQLERNATGLKLLTPLSADFFLQSVGCTASDPGNGPCHFLSVYRKDALYKQLLPVREDISLATARIHGYIPMPKVIENGTALVSTPLDFGLYRVSADSAVKIAQIVFPGSRMLSADILRTKDPRVLDSIRKSIDSRQELILNVENLFFLGNKLFFKLVVPVYAIASQSAMNKYQYNFVYDTASGKLSTLDRVTPDEASWYLPLFSEGAKSGGAAIFQKQLYSHISSLQLFQSLDAAKARQAKFPPVLENYFKKSDRTSNPVIVRMKLKE
ncbi:6-bladed beta-propeller [Chitinophaga caseinilytica]|uniref:6-bladed beta-propeller n=1 Tax=Chitinophaga caseinilytica TaxID=2267521 RepID=A0ABZ2Z3U6_9BACT